MTDITSSQIPYKAIDPRKGRPYDWLKVSTDCRVHAALCSVIEQSISVTSTSLSNRRTPTNVRVYLMMYFDCKYNNYNISRKDLNEVLKDFKDERECVAEVFGYKGTNAISHSERLIDHICSLCLDLIYSYSHNPYEALGISLNNNSYKVKSIYNKTKRSITFTNAALDFLFSFDLVEIDLGHWEPTEAPGQCTRLRGTLKLANMFFGVCPTLITHDYRLSETVILRSPENENGDVEDIEYEESPITIEMRSAINEINSCLSNVVISLPYADCERIYRAICDECAAEGKEPPDPLSIPDFTRKHYYRIFNEANFEKGGRAYRPFWQGIDKRYRPALRIDGEPVVEIDISFLHPLLLYWREKAPLWFDPYNLRIVGGDPLMRGKGKLVFQRMVNTNSRGMAENAVRNDDFRNGKRVEVLPEDRLGPSCVPLVGMLDDLNRPIQNQLYAMGGLDLQFIDSQIAMEVMLTLARMGIAVLGIHDSFAVKERHKDVLVWAIDKALHGWMPKTGRFKHQHARGIMYKAKHADGREERFPSPLSALYLNCFSYRATEADIRTYLDLGARTTPVLRSAA